MVSFSYFAESLELELNTTHVINSFLAFAREGKKLASDVADTIGDCSFFFIIYKNEDGIPELISYH